MENAMKFESEWHRYDESDPKTYPPEEGDYLVTLSFSSGQRDFTDFHWMGDDTKWGGGVYITHWAKVEPCTESEEQEEPEVEGSDVEYRTVTLRELSRSHKLDVNTLIAVKNALKWKLDCLENPFGEATCVNSEAKDVFLSQCTEVEDRFEYRPEIPPYESLCYSYNELLRTFAKMHPVLSDSVNGIEITIE